MKFAKTIVKTSKIGNYRAQAPLTSWLVAALVVGCSLIACAQTPADEKKSPAPSPTPETQSPELSLPPLRLKSLPRNLFLDQKSFWSAPFHMTRTEWRWTVPLAFVGARVWCGATPVGKQAPPRF